MYYLLWENHEKTQNIHSKIRNEKLVKASGLPGEYQGLSLAT